MVFEKTFETADAYQKIPEFWAEYRDKYLMPLLLADKQPENEVEETICNCCVGEFEFPLMI